MSQTAVHHAEPRFVTIPSGEVAVLDRPATGPARGTALMVPGFTGSKEDFAPVLDPLSRAGFRVVCMDLPGQYQSPGPRDRERYTTAWLGSVVTELAASLDERPVQLLGHSFGGLVARAAVLAAPRRYRSLVLLCSGPAAIGGERRERIAEMRPYAELDMAAIYTARLARYPLDPDTPPEVAEFLRRRFLASSRAGLLGMSDSLVAEPDRVEALRATGVPVLVCFGDADDAWGPVLQRRMAARLGASVEVVAHAGHSPAVDQPLATAASLAAFWSGHRTAGVSVSSSAH